MAKAWDGRFKESNAPLFEKMNKSLDFDIRMFKQDIKLNKIYSKELCRIGLISQEDLKDIESGLSQVEKDIEENGINAFEDNVEDIHMGVETLLFTKIGDAAKKMHGGKSRNDQVATDMRMFLFDEIKNIQDNLKSFMRELLNLSKNNLDVVMPGFTHLRQAQPVLFSHYLMSFFFSMQRDYSRLEDSLKRVSIMPLGSAALAGSGFPLDRNNLASGLGFENISENSMDGVLSRDFILEFLSNTSILSLTLSRFAEDFIIFTNENFNFFELSDKVTTGSSIMPNKKNPDGLELTRGKTGRIIGSFVGLFTTLKGLPSTYNKDLQEDKEKLFDVIDTVNQILEVNVILLKNLKINKERMNDSIDSLSFATELADYLSLKNVPFREAHRITGKIVAYCIEKKILLTSLKESDLTEMNPNFKDIGDDWGSVEKFLKRREIRGGTGVESVKKQIFIAEEFCS